MMSKVTKHFSFIFWLPAVVVAISIQACGPGSQSTGGPTSQPKAPVTELPEPHGPVRFQPATADSQSLNTPPAPQKTEPKPAEPATLDEQEVSVSKRHPLCQDAYDPRKVQPIGLTCPVCLKGQFSQPQPKRMKLDILFVADSSPSLETERSAIARGIRQFVEALPAETDYRVAVMAAHSDTSYDTKNKPSTGLAGRLLVAGGEPAVLNGSDFRDLASLSQQLVRKLTKIPVDAASDGGELGLFSLDRGISEPRLSENQRLGFFRDDAALAVIFVSDENDICSYGVNYSEGSEPKKNVNNYLKTGLTVEEKANQFYCRDAGGVPVITSRSVFAKLRGLKKIENQAANVSRPLLISGVLYTTEASVPLVVGPNERFPEYFSENEVGRGYLEMIKDNNDVPVDIAKGNFSEGLRQIGDQARVKLEVKSEFQLKEGASVDKNTLCVVVDGKEAAEVSDLSTRIDGLSYAYKADLRELQLRGIGGRNSQGGASKVEVFYCEPPSVLDFDPERFAESDLPTKAEHYRNLPVPNACARVKARIGSGALDRD